MRVRRLILRPVAAAAAAVSAATAAAASTSASTTASPPPILYGTAWKRERTCELVLAALRAGFRGIDTACQPKHYDEAAVGAALETSGLRRADLYVQTKYTPLAGQDPDRLPYLSTCTSQADFVAKAEAGRRAVCWVPISARASPGRTD